MSYKDLSITEFYEAYKSTYIADFDTKDYIRYRTSNLDPEMFNELYKEFNRLCGARISFIFPVIYISKPLNLQSNYVGYCPDMGDNDPTIDNVLQCFFDKKILIGDKSLYIYRNEITLIEFYLKFTEDHAKKEATIKALNDFIGDFNVYQYQTGTLDKIKTVCAIINVIYNKIDPNHIIDIDSFIKNILSENSNIIELSNIFDSLSKEVSIKKVSKADPILIKSLTIKQQTKLFRMLKDKNFLPLDADFDSFCFVFGNSIKPDNFKPLQWLQNRQLLRELTKHLKRPDINIPTSKYKLPPYFIDKHKNSILELPTNNQKAADIFDSLPDLTKI